MNKSGPAFPGTQYANGVQPTGFSQGMTLRDYFAAKAMQSIILQAVGDKEIKNIPEISYVIADAMLKAREQ